MSEAENPYFLPDDMLAGLRPVHEAESPDLVWSYELALANYRASVAAFPGPFGYGPGENCCMSEMLWQEELRERLHHDSFQRAWVATGGDWSFRRQNLVAYNAFERNWKAAGKVMV